MRDRLAAGRERAGHQRPGPRLRAVGSGRARRAARFPARSRDGTERRGRRSGPASRIRISPDVHAAYVAAGGVQPTELPIPAAPSLIGAQFHEQVVPFELDASGSFVLITSTNALTATIGVP